MFTMTSRASFAGFLALVTPLSSVLASPVETHDAKHLAARTMPASPRPTITSTEITLPYPFFYPTVTLTTDSAGRPLASLSALSQNSCGRRTAWLNTTTVGVQVPCLGATQLSSRTQFGKCPLGGGGGPPQPPTVLATHTLFTFECSPTPDPNPRVPLTDFSVGLPAPTLPAGFQPSYTPYSVEAWSAAEGWCYAHVAVTMTDEQVWTTECAQCATCSHPTEYPSTVTTTVGVNCKPFAGRCPYETLTWVGDWRRCASVEPWNQAQTVTAAAPRTTWKYECLPTQTP